MASALAGGGRLISAPAIGRFSGSALIFFGEISWRAPRVPDRFLLEMRSSTGSGLIISGCDSALIARGMGSDLIIGGWWIGQNRLMRI